VLSQCSGYTSVGPVPDDATAKSSNIVYRWFIEFLPKIKVGFSLNTRFDALITFSRIYHGLRKLYCLSEVLLFFSK
jgi:hypothetical protein